jgi:transposase
LKRPEQLEVAKAWSTTVLSLLSNEDQVEVTRFIRTPVGRQFADLYDRLVDLDERIARYEQRIQQIFAASPICKKIEQVRGVGPLIATAVVATAGDGKEFRRGRQFAAWLGLVPRQHSSGGKPRLLGISKRGDKYLRMLLIHGARAVVAQAEHRDDRLSRWVNGIKARAGANVAAVALANKNARVIWALLTRDAPYEVPA